MRQFDASMQKLQKLFYLFLKEEGIASLDEFVSLLEVLKSNVYNESRLSEAWAESDRRIAALKAGEPPKSTQQ
jgi:hypothetical protein